MIGQILSDYLNNGEIIEDEDEAIRFIQNDLRYDVFRFIRAELSPVEVFFWMYCTACSDLFFIEDEDESIVEIFNYEDYSKAVEEVISQQNDCIDGDMMQAFDFICQVM